MSRLSGRGIARRVARYMRQPGASHTATHAYMYVPFPTGGRERDANALPVRNQCATRASYALGCAHLNLRARLHRIKVFCSTRVARSVVRARFARLVAHRFALWSGLRSRGRSCGRSVGFRSVFAACAGLCRGLVVSARGAHAIQYNRSCRRSRVQVSRGAFGRAAACLWPCARRGLRVRAEQLEEVDARGSVRFLRAQARTQRRARCAFRGAFDPRLGVRPARRAARPRVTAQAGFAWVLPDAIVPSGLAAIGGEEFWDS